MMICLSHAYIHTTLGQDVHQTHYPMHDDYHHTLMGCYIDHSKEHAASYLMAVLLCGDCVSHR